MSDSGNLGRVETFLYILLVIQILALVGMFLIIQQVNKAVTEIKKFCWGEQVGDAVVNGQPYLDIIH